MHEDSFMSVLRKELLMKQTLLSCPAYFFSTLAAKLMGMNAMQCLSYSLS